MRSCVLALVAVVLAGCAGIANKQYEQAHQRYLEALDRVTVLEEEIAKAKLEEDPDLVALKEEMLESAKAASEKAGAIRDETRVDAVAETEANRGFWAALFVAGMAALQVGGAMAGKAGKAAI